MDTALKPHKYNFVCKLPWTIPSVQSKFTVLCKNIITLKFRVFTQVTHTLLALLFHSSFLRVGTPPESYQDIQHNKSISWSHYICIELIRTDVYFNFLYFLNLMTRYPNCIMSLFFHIQPNKPEQWHKVDYIILLTHLLQFIIHKYPVQHNTTWAAAKTLYYVNCETSLSLNFECQLSSYQDDGEIYYNLNSYPFLTESQ